MSNTSPHCFVMGSDANRIWRPSHSGSHKQKGEPEQRCWPPSLVQPKLWKEVRHPNQMGGTAYSRWIAGNDTISNADRAAIHAHIAGFPFQPVISVIMPIGRTSEAALQLSITSVLAHLSPSW